MRACEKHAKAPVKGYCQCPGCEVESLRQRIAELESELAASTVTGISQPVTDRLSTIVLTLEYPPVAHYAVEAAPINYLI